MKRVISFFKRKDLYLGLTRYALSLWMLPYAISKILQVQFRFDPATLQQLSASELTGKQLTWLFLGHSTWFEILLGFFELIPAVLLVFRRTTLLGAVLMLPMTLNVLLINFAFQLWDGTKQIAVFLFTLNCLILIFEWRRIRFMWQLALQKSVVTKYPAVEWIINIVFLAGMILYITVILLK
ncbi:MAG: hypothetical protein EOP45_22705 [Sphingobacteriaceae bacterium]|nr:MAG: hypothetical protein EOP45_22705 [Sphingobacteriaceae bacterium]